MAKVTRTFSFLSDVDGLYESSMVSGHIWSYYASDGSPAVGCGKWSISLASGVSSVKTGLSLTWQDFGVPVGSRITSIQLKSYRGKNGQQAGAYGSLKFRMLFGSISVTGQDLYSLILPAIGWQFDNTWIEFSGGSLQDVATPYQSSDMNIQLEMEVNLSINPIVTAIFYLDEITLDIYYEGGCSGGQLFLEDDSTVEQVFDYDVETYSVISGDNTLIEWNSDGSPTNGSLLIRTDTSDFRGDNIVYNITQFG